MQEKDIELALYIIKYKIAKETKDNKEKNYSEFKRKIQNLRKEEKEIYKQNEKVINKVLTDYAKDVQNNEA